MNDIEQIETDFILVLDDYHHIHKTAIHNLLNQMLQYPSTIMHLVIASRGDPPVNLNQLRARGKMTEMRHVDLRFSLEETSTFMNDVMGIHLDQAEVVELWEKTEGWVTALRLAALSMRHQEDLAGLLGRLQGGSHYLQEYLMGEVLSHQPPDIQEWLLKTTILERFCAPLCEADLSGRGWGSGKCAQWRCVFKMAQGGRVVRDRPRRPGRVVPLPPTCSKACCRTGSRASIVKMRSRICTRVPVPGFLKTA